jgi:Ser/Thr protein kinase RdoA (MazF antagonist)
MAELHEAGNSGRLVSDALKDSEIHWLRDRWSRIVAMTTPSGSPAIPPATSDDIEAMLADLFQDFRRADIPATMVHGDAHGGNFSVAPDGHVDTIDV